VKASGLKTRTAFPERGPRTLSAARSALIAIVSPLSLVGLSTIVSSCDGAAKRETSALYEAVDRYRVADDAAKLVRGQAVAAVECTVAPVCDAKRICLAAIDPTTRALRLKDEVALRVADVEHNRLDPTSPEARGLSGELDEAARLLESGRQKMTECERRLADLRVTHGS